MKASLKIATLEELLSAYKKADADAFREFFERTHALVYRFLCLKLNNKTEAEDVLQDTYFRVHKYIATYDSEKNAITWIMSIARSALYRYVETRRPKGLEFSVNDELPDESKQASTQAELSDFVASITQNLSDEERELFISRIMDESSYEDIAENLGISVESARKRVSRLVKKLRLLIASAS